ncbi:MAG: TerB family tellurite resistance protein [Chitinophagaceae bacterium]
MEQQEKLLKDYSDAEKGAYLGAIASIATADHTASEEELEYILQLAESADISDEQKQAVIRAATELSGDELARCLDILKTSDLRFSLITDLMNFGQSDQDYSAEEKKNVEKIASYLQINQEQFSLLDQFVNKTSQVEVAPEEAGNPGFLSSLGLDEKFKKAGIDWKTVGKGLLGIAGPMILARMLSGRRRGNRNTFAGGGLGSSAGGGIGSMLGRGGGLGSLIGGLSGGRGFANSGGLLSRVLKGLKI